jgi:DNA-directed RNA polymerase subunit RPC12/RpoP
VTPPLVIDKLYSHPFFRSKIRSVFYQNWYRNVEAEDLLFLLHITGFVYKERSDDMDRMNQFRYYMQNKMAQFFYGRNGFDNMARACNAMAILLLVINIFAQSAVIYFLWVAFFGYSLFRVYSKNIPKRYAENQKYLAVTAAPRRRLKLLPLQWRDRKVSRYYICRSCHQQIRVPKGKGRIEIRCPKCGERFVKKT